VDLDRALPLLACPRCGGALAREEGPGAPARATPGEALACEACGACYPVRFGIPDLRLEPDPWIGIDEEIAKIERVEARARGGGFAAWVRAYWEETPGTPARLAARYAAGVTRGIDREQRRLDRALAAPGGERDARVVVDVGCGSGALAAAAATLGHPAIGVDVALRWLAGARRRFAEMGLGGRAPLLVAASADALPLARGVAAAVVGDDVLDHLRAPERALAEFRRALAPGGRLYQTSPNKHSIALEPHARLPALGFLPAAVRPAVARALRGVDYREVFLLSAGDIDRLLRDAGFEEVSVEPAPLFAGGSFYESVRRSGPGRAFLRAVGPVLEVSARAPRRAGL
jgi:SAM-dependent methyltransferase